MKKNISECKCQIHVGDVGASSSKKKINNDELRSTGKRRIIIFY